MPERDKTDGVPVIGEDLYNQKQKDQPLNLRGHRDHYRQNDRQHVYDRGYDPALFGHILEVAGRRREEAAARDVEHLAQRVQDGEGGYVEARQHEHQRDDEGQQEARDRAPQPADYAGFVGKVAAEGFLLAEAEEVLVAALVAGCLIQSVAHA